MPFSKTIEVLTEFHDGALVLSENKINYFAGTIRDYVQVEKGQNIRDILPRFDQYLMDQGGVTELNGQKFHLKIRKIKSEDKTIVLFDKESISSEAENRISILEQIIDTLNDGVIASDQEGKFILYNKAQEKLENLRSKEVLGKYLWDIYRIDPKTSEHVSVRNTKKPIIGQYRAHAYPGGVPQYTTYNTYPLLKDDKPIGAFSICVNETKLKDLLHETIELKRKLFKSPISEKIDANNGTTFNFDHIKGDSPEMIELIREAQNISLYNTDVLIVGETGTGKELFAQSIHNHSPRSKSPFIAVNCAAIPETLLESTLFGSAKGAFTGAIDQVGLFEYAQDGTLFLDEINSMPITLQSKLIRVLEERKVRRLGSNVTKSVHCQVITASNENPQTLIKNNRLRLDLYYRIAKTCLMIPPLRDRSKDISFFIQYFINKFNDKYKKDLKGLTRNLEDIFFQYPWPGNTREFEHVIENLVIRAGSDEQYLDMKHLPSYLIDTFGNVFDPLSIKGRKLVDRNPPPLKRTKKVVNEDEILFELESAGWNITRAAQNIGISRQNLQYYIKKLHITLPVNEE